jgi:DNA (cytosine-5)-methyltransferase 1
MKITMKKYTVGSLFAGIGGIDLGFEQAGFLPIWANEIDQYCAQTFNANRKETKLLVKDICELTSKDIPDIDILAGGFPCQPFSIAGFKKGFKDDRGNLFFQIIRLIKELKQESRQCKIVFLENVKNMFSHDGGKTYLFMKEKLQELGYTIKEKILNTCEYGNIPQNRERLYIVGFLNKHQAQNFVFPKKIKLTNTIEKCIKFNDDVPPKYFYTPQNCKGYQLLEDNIKTVGAIYQFRRVYIRKNKSGVCPTLTANMGTGGHNVPIIINNQGRMRKLLPRECLSIQGFPKNFIIPQALHDSRVYKQAGNSVSVNVIKRIAQQISEVINNE